MISEGRYTHPNPILRRYHLKRLRTAINKLARIAKTTGYVNLTFLDVGCGDGTYELLLDKEFDYLVGLDITLNNLETAKKRVKSKNKVDFILADTKHLPFKDLSVDIALCSEVLEHLYDPSKALLELSRVFRKTLLLTMPILNISRSTAKILHYDHRVGEIEANIGHVSMHDWLWWRSLTYETVKKRRVKCNVKITHLYITSEPFTSIFASCKNIIILKAIDKILDVMEKILSHSISANHLIITLIVQ